MSMSSRSFAPIRANSRHCVARPASASHRRSPTVISRASSNTSANSRHRTFCHSDVPHSIPRRARSHARFPSSFFASVSMHASTRSSATSPMRPPYTAPGVVSNAHRWRAVLPSSSTHSTSAPAARSFATALAWPKREAMSNAVTLEWFTSAPASTRASTRPQWPWRDA